MESFGFRYPFLKGIRRILHGQDHHQDLSVESHGELGDSHELVFKLGLGGKVFEVIDVLLESVIWGSVFIFPRFLDKLGQVSPCLYFGIEGVKVPIVVVNELCKGFVFGFE